MATSCSAMKFGVWKVEVKNLKRPQVHKDVDCFVFAGIGARFIQRYGSTRRMLMRSETAGRNSIDMVPLTCTCPTVYGPVVLTPN